MKESGVGGELDLVASTAEESNKKKPDGSKLTLCLFQSSCVPNVTVELSFPVRLHSEESRILSELVSGDRSAASPASRRPEAPSVLSPHGFSLLQDRLQGTLAVPVRTSPGRARCRTAVTRSAGRSRNRGTARAVSRSRTTAWLLSER